MSDETNDEPPLPTNGIPQNGQASSPSAGRGHSDPGREDEVTLRELAGMLWRGKWIIVATAVVVLASAAAYTYSRTPIYQASSVLLVDRGEQFWASKLHYYMTRAPSYNFPYTFGYLFSKEIGRAHV